MSYQQKCRLGALLSGVLMLTMPRTSQGQTVGLPLPIPGFTYVLALPESVDTFYKDVGTGLEKTVDGIHRITTETSRSQVHDRDESLNALQPGTPVLVHYSVKGIQASPDETERLGSDTPAPNEGTVTSVDRSRKRIAVRFAGGTTETFRAAARSDHDDSRVIVYRSGESRQPVPYYFKPSRQ
jgi:hypothetical protein